jgi:hypothetical protein
MCISKTTYYLNESGLIVNEGQIEDVQYTIGMVENAGTGYRVPDTDTDTGYGYRIRIPDTGYGYRIPDSLKYLFLRIKIVGYCIFSRFLSHF